jgi:hypothetical protein
MFRPANGISGLAFALLVATTLSAQDPPANPLEAPATQPSRLRVFLDCRTGGCDRAFLIEEVPFIALTQDRLDAEVHVLITGLGTGAGGSQLTFAFVGQGRFAARADTLVTTVPPNTTEDTRRREVARILKLGLVPFAMRTQAIADLEVSMRDRDDEDRAPLPGIVDPWNFWVFEIDLNGDASAESRESDYEINTSFAASRVTEAAKSGFELNWEYSSRSVQLSNDTTRTFARREAQFEAFHVKSLGDHWSSGIHGAVGIDEFRNQDLNGELNALIEYNIFPYRLATQKQLVLIGFIGARHFDYTEETIYLRTAETRAVANLTFAGISRQRWGSADASLSWHQFLHDASAYSLNLDASINVRVTRGLSVNFEAFGSKINDQLYISREGVPDDEILTEQRALATAYRFGGSVGLSFTFGSIYNTIVNPRFDRID